MGFTAISICGRVLLYQINHNAKAPSTTTNTVHVMAIAIVAPTGNDLLLSATSVGLFGGGRSPNEVNQYHLGSLFDVLFRSD